MEFTAVYLDVADGVLAFIEELPGANARGATLEEARDRLRLAIQSLFDTNRDLAESNLALASMPFHKEALALTGV
jgi:predicted RNase H-like HicB family nuclease